MNRQSATTALNLSPWRVLLPVGLGTGLSLIGDTSLYAVLPTHADEAGVVLAGIGILLSANRFIRLFLNGPVGLLYDRFPRRPLFVLALFIGAVSTAFYALTMGFWPLFAGRLLWGVAWAGIWVGGNSIILDISHAHNRGRWVGFYQISFYLGASGGAILGGFLTDWLGYHSAMGVGAGLTLFGAIIALLFLPETRYMQPVPNTAEPVAGDFAGQKVKPTRWAELASAMGLMGVNRLVIPGILMPTFGLFLLQQMGDTVQIGSWAFGVASVTGLALGANALISMVSAPVMGGWSDKVRSRWQVVAGGLIPGVAGFGLLALSFPAALLLGIALAAVTGGSNQSLSTALVGDLSDEQRRGRRLGILFTVGDLASAVGPLLVYAIIPLLGLSLIYLLSAGLFGLMFGVALVWVFSART